MARRGVPPSPVVGAPTRGRARSVAGPLLRPERVVPVLLGLAFLLHEAKYFWWPQPPLVRLNSLLIAGFGLLLALGRLRTLGALALLGTVCVDAVWNYHNHVLLAQFIALGLVVGGLLDRPDAREPGVFPVLRGMYVLGYLLAAFHKVNPGFLDPLDSTAVAHARSILYDLRLIDSPAAMLPQAVAATAIAGTFVFEVGLPVLVLLPISRLWAGLGMVLFHLPLTVNGNGTIAAFFFAMYAAFLTPADWSRLRKAFRRSGPTALAVAGLTALALGVIGPWFPFWLLLGVGYLVFLLVLFLGALRERDGVGPSARAGLPKHSARLRLAQGALLGLFVLNGFAPYLGLKNVASLTMSSNLVTEGGQWNHLWVPRALNVFGGGRYFTLDLAPGWRPPAGVRVPAELAWYLEQSDRLQFLVGRHLPRLARSLERTPFEVPLTVGLPDGTRLSAAEARQFARSDPSVLARLVERLRFREVAARSPETSTLGAFKPFRPPLPAGSAAVVRAGSGP